MITIEQTITIPADRRLHLDMTLPQSVPSGRTSIVLIIPTSEPAESAEEEAPLVYKPAPEPTIEELMEDARQKTEARLADPSGDSLQKYCGCLEDAFPEDGLVYQRRMRDEWPD